MRKRMIYQAAYYVAVPAAVLLLWYGLGLLYNATGDRENLGRAIAWTYGMVFLATPVLLAVLMRFTRLPWIVDPFAAAECPLLFCGVIVVKNYVRNGSWATALAALRMELTDDGSTFVWVLAGSFLFCLLCSLSFARPKGNGLPDRLFFRKQ